VVFICFDIPGYKCQVPECLAHKPRRTKVQQLN